VIARFVPQTDPATNKQIIMSQNLDYSQLATVSASIVTPLTPWWQSNLNISGTWNKVKGIVNNEMTVFSQAYFSLNGSEIIMLPKRFSFELSGNFTSRSLQPAFFGAAAVEPFGQLNLALQKKLGRQGNTLTLGADNVLNTFKWSTSLSAPGQGIETNSVVDFFPPLYKITWNQRLGNNTLREKRQRATGADGMKRVD
jgi:hypothetical protein